VPSLPYEFCQAEWYTENYIWGCLLVCSFKKWKLMYSFLPFTMAIGEPVEMRVASRIRWAKKWPSISNRPARGSRQIWFTKPSYNFANKLGVPVSQLNIVSSLEFMESGYGWLRLQILKKSQNWLLMAWLLTGFSAAEWINIFYHSCICKIDADWTVMPAIRRVS